MDLREPCRVLGTQPENQTGALAECSTRPLEKSVKLSNRPGSDEVKQPRLWIQILYTSTSDLDTAKPQITSNF